MNIYIYIYVYIHIITSTVVDGEQILPVPRLHSQSNVTSFVPHKAVKVIT